MANGKRASERTAGDAASRIEPPRFADGVKTIQVDIQPEEIGRNVPAEVGLVGDLKAIVGQLNAALEAEPFTFAADAPWRAALAEKVDENKTFVANMMDEGAGSRDATALQSELAFLGATLSVGASWDFTTVSLKVARRNLEPALELMADVVLRTVRRYATGRPLPIAPHA